MPLYIVEGVDRTGKTSLCEAQPAHTRLTHLHFSAPKRHPLDEYVRPLETYLPGSGEEIWCDRHYLGELVWPEIFKRKTEFTEPMVRYVEAFLASRGALCVYADRRTGLSSAVRGEPVDGHLLDALHMFQDATVESHLDWLKYEQTEPGSALRVKAYGLARERLVAPLHKATSRWVGSPHAQVLLVGEQVGPASRGWQLPFVPYRSASGHFLMQELREFTRPFALVNSITPSGKLERVPELHAALGKPQIIALGAAAEKNLRRNGLSSISRVPHPQYWRRFMRREGPGSYRKLLEEAI